LLRIRSAIFDVDETRLSPPRRWAVVSARLVWLVLRAFFRDRLQIRAASLAFSTMLAIVPALALAFAIAQATGLYALLRDETIMPFVEETLGGEAAADSRGVALLRGAILGVLALVSDTSIAGLGIGGTFVLVLAIWRVVRGVDESFHHVFEQRGPEQPFWQRLRAWIVCAIATPLGLTYAMTSASLAHGDASQWVASWIPIPWARDLLLFVLPPLVVTLTLFVLYVELPDTIVRKRSALFGAVIAGIAWYAVQLTHVRFQVGLARWNAIYSGFGAFPILLAITQISWVIVLIGAQLVALHMRSPTLRVLASGARRDYATLSTLGLEAALALVASKEPVAMRELARRLEADLATLTVVVDSLENAGIVGTIDRGGDRACSLAVEASALRTSDVLAAIGRGPDVELPWREASSTVREALDRHHSAASTSEHNLTLAELHARAKP
jgi:membrane protein